LKKQCRDYERRFLGGSVRTAPRGLKKRKRRPLTKCSPRGEKGKPDRSTEISYPKEDKGASERGVEKEKRRCSKLSSGHWLSSVSGGSSQKYGEKGGKKI